MDPAELDERLMASLLAASRVLVAMSAASIESSPIEVTLNQYRALVVLALTPSIHMAELGRELGMSPSSATRLVERLERKGLVARAMSGTSRRSIDVRLEPAGEELVASVMAERRRRFAELLADVAPRRREALCRAFEDFARLAGEPVGNLPPALTGGGASR